MKNSMKQALFTKDSIIAVLICITCLTLASCVTSAEDIPADLSPQLFFRQAQESIDRLNWDEARLYLNEYKNRYPNDTADNLAADYQLAQIRYKEGQLAVAREQFMDILVVYEADITGELHEWVRILSEEFIVRIDERLIIPINEDEASEDTVTEDPVTEDSVDEDEQNEDQ